MELRPHRTVKRKKTKQINVGNVFIGGDSPISVQSMTNTLTTDIKSTIHQINSLEEKGADIVRVSCPDKESTDALKTISKEVNVPIVADIHFHHKRAIEAASNGASCLRINPGNIGSKERVLDVVKASKDYNCSIRIGVNAGSLEKKLLEKYKEPCPDALVESAMYNIKLLEDNDFFNFKISVKSSDVFLTVKSYKKLSEICDYPLHLGVTEAGGLLTGSINRSIPPSENEIRNIPNISQILNGNLVSSNPTLFSSWETVSNVERTLTWGVTVRDRSESNPNGMGQISQDVKRIFVTFLLESGTIFIFGKDPVFSGFIDLNFN